MSSWKFTRSKKQLAQKNKIAIISLSALIFLLILAQLIKFTNTLFSSWKLPSINQKIFSWNKDYNINLLARSDQISLISYSPKKEAITIINLPDNLFFETTGGFGKWQLNSVYGVGGYKLLKNSISALFGLPIDAVVEGDLTQAITEDQFSLPSIISNFKTNLRLWDLIQLQMGMSKVRFDKIHQVNLDSLGILEESLLADGSQTFTADPTRLDSSLENMVEPNFTEEHKTIAVFNSTDHPQIAQKAARLITNIGGDVIIVSNGKIKLNQTIISGEKSKTLDRLKQIFEADGTIDPSLSEEINSSRAQINLFLGEDFASRL